MNARTWLPRVVLCVAAAASIATSKAPVDLVPLDTRPLPEATLDTQTPIRRWAILAELRTNVEGAITVEVLPRGQTQARAAEVIVRMHLAGEDGAADMIESVFLQPDGTGQVFVDKLAWRGCPSESCIAELELSIELANPQSGDLVQIGGDVQIGAYLDENGSQTASGSLLAVDLLP